MSFPIGNLTSFIIKHSASEVSEFRRSSLNMFLMISFQVNIPVVPMLPKVCDAENGGETLLLNRLNRSSSNPPVSPHRINNFVYESSPNRLILDFGDVSKEMVKTWLENINTFKSLLRNLIYLLELLKLKCSFVAYT